MTTLLVTGTGAGFYFTEMLFNKGYSLVLQYPYEVIGVCSFFGKAFFNIALFHMFLTKTNICCFYSAAILTG